ncbi:glycosyltransferase family 9 protein [Piscirickettsia litoralis]|uniref:Glycosyl transferase family 9 n=1 Tax=Piscirickettsia litoralis TaxID=1891921 RepID=A0ABX3A5E4_9GAMM|nr:glycosyltransferase family 9 protein [Piscirickettsia litoralis]ODN42655.1 hypothetical protein BGC07_06625 [Piscirickettsia litoralis]
MNIANKRIGIIKQCKIGDAVVALPVAAAIKKSEPSAKVVFIGDSYIQDIVQCSPHVDEFQALNISAEAEYYTNEQMIEQLRQMNLDVVIHTRPHRYIMYWVKKAGIKTRIATSHRLYSFLSCNKLVNSGRSASIKHEAEYDLELLKPLKLQTKDRFRLVDMIQLERPENTVQTNINDLLSKDKFKLVLHIGAESAGGRNWSVQKYIELAEKLSDNFQVILTGSKHEQELCHQFIQNCNRDVLNSCGKLPLNELVCFLAKIDGMLAASTGPLHIAAALGKYCLGLYPATKIHAPTRWGPIGELAVALAPKRECAGCNDKSRKCTCVDSIPSHLVSDIIESWQNGNDHNNQCEPNNIPEHIKLWSAKNSVI